MAEQNDIGFAVEAQNLTDEDLIKYLNPWTPNNNNEFPQSHHIKNNNTVGYRACILEIFTSSQ